MASYKIHIRKDKINKKGIGPIVLTYTHARAPFKFPLGIYIKVQDWDEEKVRVKKSEPNYATYNEQIENAEKRANKAIADFEAYNIEPTYDNFLKSYNAPLDDLNSFDQMYKELKQVNAIFDLPENDGLDLLVQNDFPEDQHRVEVIRAELSGEKAKKEAQASAEANLLKAWDAYLIASKKAEKSDNTLIRLPNTLNILKAYLEHAGLPLTFDTFNEEFDQGFRSYMAKHHKNYVTKEKGVLLSTTINNLKHMAAFLNWAVIKKYHTNLEFKQWKLSKPDTDMQWLNLEQIKPLLTLDLSKHVAWERTLDAWLFSAFTGLRYSDIREWRKSNVKGKFIRLRTFKTKKLVTIPLNDVTRRILAKYDGMVPVKANVVFNREIKEVLKFAGFDELVKRERTLGKRVFHYDEMPLYNAITFHSARRSMINNFIALNFNIKQMNEMTGIDLRTLATYFKKDERSLENMMDGISFLEPEALQLVA